MDGCLDFWHSVTANSKLSSLMQWLKLVYVKNISFQLSLFISTESIHQKRDIFCQYRYFWSHRKIQLLHCVVPWKVFHCINSSIEVRSYYSSFQWFTIEQTVGNYCTWKNQMDDLNRNAGSSVNSLFTSAVAYVCIVSSSNEFPEVLSLVLLNAEC